MIVVNHLHRHQNRSEARTFGPSRLRKNSVSDAFSVASGLRLAGGCVRLASNRESVDPCRLRGQAENPDQFVDHPEASIRPARPSPFRFTRQAIRRE